MDTREIELQTFIHVAQLIAGPEAPVWLAKHLLRWSPSLQIDLAVQHAQPSRAEMKMRLAEIGTAASALLCRLRDTATREFLEQAGGIRIENQGGLERALHVIGEHAAIAAASPTLSTKSGKTKAGRGRALPPGCLSSKGYCALHIVQAWAFLRNEYPAPRSRKAAEAAETYWTASGGATTGWGSDRLNGWRPYLKEACSSAPEELKKEIRRHLIESQKRQF